MYAENFRALVKREHLESLELGLLGTKECFVVDSRVPQEWLRPGPCHACHSLERRLFLWAKFADCFQKDPQVESLVGTKWVLGSRKDSDGMLERMLPGDSIEFRATELICRTASGEVSAGRSWERSASAPVSLSAYSALSTSDYTGTVVEVTQTPDRLELRGRRSWEVSGSNTPVSIYVYDILSTGDYTGTVVEITRDKDRMVLVPALTLSRSAHTLRRERYRGTAIAIYRPER